MTTSTPAEPREVLEHQLGRPDEGPEQGDTTVQQGDAPKKRGRGRPKGSVNKKKLLPEESSPGAPAGSSTSVSLAKRTRPQKEQMVDGDAVGEEDEAEPAQKRKRGRPAKALNNNKPTEQVAGEAGGEVPEAPAKRKRGRPKKSTSS